MWIRRDKINVFRDVMPCGVIDMVETYDTAQHDISEDCSFIIHCWGLWHILEDSKFYKFSLKLCFFLIPVPWKLKKLCICSPGVKCIKISIQWGLSHEAVGEMWGPSTSQPWRSRLLKHEYYQFSLSTVLVLYVMWSFHGDFRQWVFVGKSSVPTFCRFSHHEGLMLWALLLHIVFVPHNVIKFES
jgi:hypothetical protein